MKRNFSTVLTTLDDKPFEAEAPRYKVEAGKVVMKDGEPVIDKPAVYLTLERVALDAIAANLDADRSMSGEDKFKLFELANRIVVACKAGTPVELDDKEITTLKGRISQTWPILVVGRSFEVLSKDFEPSGDREQDEA